MCGIVGAIAERNVTPILLEGLKRLEYRGYDSAGIAAIDNTGNLEWRRAAGKVRMLEKSLTDIPVIGSLGIAHTRWATHGEPSVRNAHPHVSNSSVAVVHNGIIENHQELKAFLLAEGYRFESGTNTEVIAHLIDYHLHKEPDLLVAVQKAVAQINGAYSLGVISRREPGRLVAARQGSPLVIGTGIGEHFIASDMFALVPVSQNFIFLEDKDVADISRLRFRIYNCRGHLMERRIRLTRRVEECLLTYLGIIRMGYF